MHGYAWLSLAKNLRMTPVQQVFIGHFFAVEEKAGP
jgi:hypothetical protein